MYRLEHNVETGEVKQIELTSAEIAELEAERKIIKSKVDEELKKVQAEQIAKNALLNRLGLTEDEAKLLLS